MDGNSGQFGGSTGPAHMLPVASYEWWQAHFARKYFGPEQAGRPVLFFVDSYELESSDVEQARPALLGDAVSALLNWRGNPYEPVALRTELWRHGSREDPPPCLPLLAATVYAAVQMRGRRGAGAPAYYDRLAEILKPAVPVDHHVKLLKDHRGTVKLLWHDLDDWMTAQGGERGVSTLRRVAKTSFIDYAKSQAVVRMTDRPALAEFLHSIPDAAHVPGFQLLDHLRRWSTNKRGLSRRFRDALENRADDEVLESLLEKLAAEGIPDVVTESGLREIRLLVRARDDFVDGWLLSWYAPSAPDVPHDTLRHSVGSITVDIAEPDAKRYTLSGSLPSIEDALPGGFSAASATAEVCLPPRNLVILGEHEEAGGLVEVSSVAVGEPYRLLFDAAGEAAARRFFAEAGERWYRPDETSVPGWCLTDEVEFTEEQHLSNALAAAGMSSVHTRAGRRARLVGGLRAKISGSIAHHCYLVGGEPDVVLSGDSSGEALLHPSLGGSPVRLSAPGYVPLRGRGLRAGNYRLEYCGQSVNFSLHELHGHLSGTRHVAARHPVADGRRIAVPVNGDVRFLTAQGKFEFPHRPAQPRWWTARGTGLDKSAQCYVDLPEEAVWLVITPETGETTITLLQEREPEIGMLSDAARHYWARLVLVGPRNGQHRRLWTRYCTSVLAHAAQTGFHRVRP